MSDVDVSTATDNAAPPPDVVGERYEQTAITGATDEERREILTGWRDMLDAALDDLAEKLRPKGESGIPAPWIKMQLHARGHGDCPCRAYAEAVKES